MDKRRIVLYGTSIIVGTVGASLKRSPQYEVIPLLPARQSELGALAPDVVVFDLEDARPNEAFSLLESLPGLMLVGLSPDTNLVKVWSGRQLRELSTNDLLGIIDGHSSIVSLSEGFESRRR